MQRTAIAFLALCLLLLPGCARKQADNQDMTPNLDAELSDDFLKITRPRPLTEQEKKALASQTDIPFNLDVRETEEVQMYLTYFTQDRRDTMERWLERAAPHLPYIRAVLATYNLPPDIIALPFIESGYNAMAYSPAGAGGMWQFMPATGRRFSLNVDWWDDERRNPYLATIAAAKYLSELYGMFNDWNLALAAYNCGEGKMSRVMAQSGRTDFFDIAKNPNLLKQETRHYVPKFLAVLKIFKNLETLGFKPVDWNAGQVLEEIPVTGGTDLASLAEACHMSWEEFHRYNPTFRRQVSAPDRQSPVYLPQAKKDMALAYLADPTSVPNRGLRQVAVGPSDNWWSLSKQSGVPVNVLRQLNPTLGDNLLSGQTVYVAMDSSFQDTIRADLTASPSPAAPAAGQYVTHRMRKGESLGALAKRYGVSKGEILKANSAKSENQLVKMAQITIPVLKPQAVPSQAAAKAAAPGEAARTHEVRKGESLGGIAGAYKTDPKAILAANGLKSEKDVKPGRKLTIPAPAREAQPSAKAQAMSAQARDSGKQTAALSPQAAAGKDAKAQARAKEGKAQAAQPATPQANAKVQAAAAPSQAKPAQHGKDSGKAVSYSVGNGETVWSIARKFKVDPNSLLAWNNLDKSVLLKPGDRLKIYAQ